MTCLADSISHVSAVVCSPYFSSVPRPWSLLSSPGAAPLHPSLRAHRYLLDYTVPFMPLRADTTRIHHVQVGVLAVAEPSLLKGYYDICFGIPQGHIYPCHMGCLINLIDGRTTDETGEVGVCVFFFYFSFLLVLQDLLVVITVSSHATSPLLFYLSSTSMRRWILRTWTACGSAPPPWGCKTSPSR